MNHRLAFGDVHVTLQWINNFDVTATSFCRTQKTIGRIKLCASGKNSNLHLRTPVHFELLAALDSKETLLLG